jgi:quinoprotein dehydrogenase-associated probable ABC transporter substrate-binding protein
MAAFSCPPKTIFAGVALIAAALCLSERAAAQAAANNKEFEDYDQVEKDAAKAAARRAHFASFRVCADPGNMPLSNKDEQGYENKIAEVIAAALGTKVSYFWRPYIERGLTRQTFDSKDCDILMDVPAGYADALTTDPIYRSTYVLAYRDDRRITVHELSDPVLKGLRVGVYETSALREALAEHGVRNVEIQEVSHDADLILEHQPWWQVQKVVDGKLDVAGVWGPFAGWLKAMKGAPIAIQPTNMMDDRIPMEFDMAIGLRKTDAITKYAIENAMNAHREEIRAILDKYGVPLLQCAECLVSGNLQAHGIYTSPFSTSAAPSSEHWTVSREQLDQWLAAGADVNNELGNAVLSSDVDRIAYLLSRGAEINKRDLQGNTPLTSASRIGNIAVIKLLLERGAQPEVSDGDGWTPLLHAILRNNVDALHALIASGARIETPAPGGYTPLSIAVEEQKFDAAKALIDAGAAVDTRLGPERLTALMVVASERPPESRIVKLTQKLGPLEIARELIARGADVNASDADGVTSLMIAAARDNSPMIGLLVQSGAKSGAKSASGETARDIAVRNDNLEAIRTFDLLEGRL